ncbi:hypothetical protein BpHYR1_053586 [Brachionus plicatilis]|uniref:Uncharacterized protein n=1 Tax=Brachionus plicatilis TaxID=10195 RepID=A0A3M7QTT6_BRAPC|nr:hypothetical protein BpHYR1_053586 [Brachionus plicatilis]
MLFLSRINSFRLGRFSKAFLFIEVILLLLRLRDFMLGLSWRKIDPLIAEIEFPIQISAIH